MKRTKLISILAVLIMLIAAVGPAYAQLGQSDISSFTIQNVDTTTASVSVTFVTETGTEITPTTLNSGQTNPFDLDPGESFEIYVPGIPSTELPDGRYSVVVSASAKVVAIANLVGQGTVNFNGSYSGFEAGSTSFYLPAVVFNYFGWYSMISVQNVGTGPADVTVNITCNNGTTGSLTQNDIPAMAAHHFVLKNTTPTGFTGSTQCNGSASVTSDEPVVVVDNQSVPTSGNTQSFSGVTSGSGSLFAPALYHSYFGWNASLNIRKLGSGNTTVTVNYSDGGSSQCNLTDAVPSCLLYMPSVHPATGYFGATITSSPSMDLVSVVNAANGAQAQTYNAVGDGTGTGTVGIPSLMKSYFGWNTSFTCQNVGSVATQFHVEYDGYAANAYDTVQKAPGETIEVVTATEAFLPAGTQVGATITATASGAEISCIVNFNNANMMNTTQGDWSMSYNAFNQ